MKLKIASIDLYLENKNIENLSFDDKTSFGDYDVVVIDPINIPNRWFDNTRVIHKEDGTLWLYSDYDNGLSKEIEYLMMKKAEEVGLVAEGNQGSVICFLRERGEMLNYAENKFYTKGSGHVGRYSWVPAIYKNPGFPCELELWIKNRYGKEFGEIVNSHSFAEYFRAFEEKIRYEAVLDEEIFSYCRGIGQVIKPIARNRAGELIAFEIDFKGGKIIFLPPLEDMNANNGKLTSVLLECIRDLMLAPQLDTPPDWVKNYKLPGEDKLNAELEKIEEKKKEIDKEENMKKTEINKLNQIKTLLYGSGKRVLEPAVREAFKIIGFNVLSPEEYKEDYDLFAKEGELLIIGEIEGSQNQINVKKYRQLLDYVDEASRNGKKCKGLLIGNGFLNEDPALRKEQFTEKAIIGCKRQHFCRIATSELFKAVEKILSSPDNQELGENIKKAILQCDNEFKSNALNPK